MAKKLEFSYDKNSPESWKRHFIKLLDDLKHDRLTDDDIAEAFADFNLSDNDSKELMNLFGSAVVKMEKRIWVDKKSMAEVLGISEKTLERFKTDHASKLTINETHKKLDGKTQRYHINNFADVYRKVRDQESWEAIVNRHSDELGTNSSKPISNRSKKKKG